MEDIAGRYEILDKDNKFIFGKLYRARDLEEDTIVFIQLIKDNIYINEKFLPNLIDESTMLAQINSHHIAKILDIGIYLTDEERCFYVVSEYFSGIELRKVIKGNYMDLNSIVKITKKILMALKRAYSHNLYHGSLSEDNIFVDEKYNIKIYDFCLTKANKGVNIRKDKVADNIKWYQISFTYNKVAVTGYVKAKYVTLARKKVVTKEPVLALSDKQFEKMLTEEGFPESYKQSLRALHQTYPYWQFKAFKTGINWNTVLKAESKLGVNLISNSKSKAWKSTEEGAYDAETGKWKVFDGSTWVAASKKAIAYYMDPRNFLNERNIFQFELLEYQSQYQTKEGINSIIQNTPFYQKSFSYKDMTTGEKKNMKYVTAFVQAAKKSGVSPYHLASRVKQEVVTSATTTSIAVTGTNSSYPGIYNFYNIGATSSSNPAVNGLKWASKGDTYLRPWTDPYRSIVGGAQYIGTSYISKGQNTGYLQKFNVTSYQRYEHQYMTNVEAAYSEAIKTRQAYAGSMDKTPIIFSIPVYENMPENKCTPPQ